MIKANERLPESQVQQNAENRQFADNIPVRKSKRKTKKTLKREFTLNVVKMIMENVEEGLKMETFAGKGKGVVATKVFKRGDFICEYVGELLDSKQTKIREALYAQDPSIGCYIFYFKYLNRQFSIDATPDTSRFGRLINHSRNGNLTAEVVCVDKVPRVVYFAKKDIQINEELTFDYGDRSKKALMFHPWLAT